MPKRRRKKKRKTKEKERERATDRELAASNTGWISLLSEHRWTAEGEGESEVGGEGGGEEGKVVSRSVETKHQELQWRQMLVWEPLSKVRPHRWGRCKKQGQVQDQGMEERQEEEVEQEEGEGGGGTRAEARVGEEVKMRTGEEEGEGGEEEGGGRERDGGEGTEGGVQKIESAFASLEISAEAGAPAAAQQQGDAATTGGGGGRRDPTDGKGKGKGGGGVKGGNRPQQQVEGASGVRESVPADGASPAKHKKDSRKKRWEVVDNFMGLASFPPSLPPSLPAPSPSIKRTLPPHSCFLPCARCRVQTLAAQCPHPRQQSHIPLNPNHKTILNRQRGSERRKAQGRHCSPRWWRKTGRRG